MGAGVADRGADARARRRTFDVVGCGATLRREHDPVDRIVLLPQALSPAHGAPPTDTTRVTPLPLSLRPDTGGVPKRETRVSTRRIDTTGGGDHDTKGTPAPRRTHRRRPAPSRVGRVVRCVAERTMVWFQHLVVRETPACR